MKELVIVIVGVSSIAAVASFISHPRHRSLTGGAIALLIALFIAMPLSSYLSELFHSDAFLPPDFDYDTGSPEYEEVAREAFLDGIRRLIADEFSVDKEYILVKCDGFNFEDFTYERLYVTLRGRAASADARGIRFFIEENFTGECRVEIEVG